MPQCQCHKQMNVAGQHKWLQGLPVYVGAQRSSPARAMLRCSVLQAKGANEARPTIPGQEWRTAIVLLCWITSGLFGILFFVHLGRIGVSCCKKRRRGHASDQDLEKAGLAAGRPPSAAVELGKEIANRCADQAHMQQSAYLAAASAFRLPAALALL